MRRPTERLQRKTKITPKGKSPTAPRVDGTCGPGAQGTQKVEVRGQANLVRALRKSKKDACSQMTYTSTNLSPDALSTETDWTYRWTFPLAPSPQNSSILMLANFDAVGQTSASSAQVVVCSPVAEDHLSLNVLNGIFTSTKSSPAGTVNLFLKHPRLKGGNHHQH